MTETLSAAWLETHLTDRTMRGIAIAMSALIRSGAIPVGTQLPPVREVAQALGISPATVSTAWGELRRFKVVTGRGRNGVWVCGSQATPRPMRFERIGNFGDKVLDLTLSVPDPALLPPLGEALRHGAAAERLHSYQRVPILPSLQRAIAPRWPYPAEAFVATNGGYEAVHVTIEALMMPTEALRKKPAAFIYQPRTHSVTGHRVSEARRRELARVLSNSDTLIIEDDGIGDISSLQPASLGNQFPQRTVHILSYSKSLGPDLRLAVLSSSSSIVNRIQAYRSFGAGWTSRILQEAAAWLIRDKQSSAIVNRSRDVYAGRRRALVDALGMRGIDLPDGDGLCVWVPVKSEQFALVTLAASGIVVLPGQMCTNFDWQHIRVSTSLLSEGADIVADTIALSETGAAGSS
jgi:DNA-binding transcriptional MocR family regulator